MLFRYYCIAGVPSAHIYFISLSLWKANIVPQHHFVKGAHVYLPLPTFSQMESDRHYLFLCNNEHSRAGMKSRKLFLKKERVINKCQLRRVWRIRSPVDHVIRTAAFLKAGQGRKTRLLQHPPPSTDNPSQQKTVSDMHERARRGTHGQSSADSEAWPMQSVLLHNDENHAN